MPYSIILKCNFEEDEKLVGEQLHSAFFNLLEQIAPKLSQQLHSPERQKAFTLAPIPQTSSYHLRITLLIDSLFNPFVKYFLETSRPALNVGNTTLRVRELLSSEGKWSGYQTYQALCDSAATDKEITLVFASPTAFRQGDLDLPLPVPRLIFSSYLQKWNRYSESPLDRELLTVIERHVALKEHDIKTVPFNDGRVAIPGFVGRCTFIIKGKLKEETIRQINCLADFAFFAGTGRKTTHGMGMTRRIR
jgi:CRISPR-associated endoribonuclease Cas6